MTLNELVAVFASDDLNPNSELVFCVDDDKFVIDDELVIDDVDDVSISLGRRDNEI